MSEGMLSIESGRAFELSRAALKDLREHRDGLMFAALLAWIEADIHRAQADMVSCNPDVLPALQARLQMLVEQRGHLIAKAAI